MTSSATETTILIEENWIIQNNNTEFISSVEKGAILEIRVADIYRQFGPLIASTNPRITGQQLDVYAELPSVDGFSPKGGIIVKIMLRVSALKR